MFKYTKDGINVLSIIDKRRPKASGLYPIKIQVVYKRVQRYYATGKELSPEDWERLSDAKVKSLKEIRESVENSFTLVKKNVEALAERGGFSFDALNLRLGKATGDTVNSAMNAKIAQLEKNDQIGTMQVYQQTIKIMDSFDGNQITFDAITVSWLKRFEQFMLQDKNQTTVGMHMRNLRVIMNDARKAGVIKETQYPFGKDKYEIQTGAARKKALTTTQIGQIVRYDDGNETTAKYRDLWLFIYLCNGINVADMVKLQYSNIVDNEIYFVRQKTERTTKTKREIRATLTPQMQQIIKRWGTAKGASNDYIFPFLKGKEDAMQRKTVTKDLTKRINKKMKRIGEVLELGAISTYTARHSFATVLKRSGANISFISESLGHNDLRTTESYLASFEKEERMKNANFLLEAFEPEENSN